MDLNPSDVVDGPEPATDAVDDVDKSSGDPQESDNIDAGSSGSSRSSKIKEFLFATEPDKDLDKVERPYDPENGGLTRIYRGLQKMAGVNGLPAIGDIIIGTAEVLDLADGGESETSEPENSETVEAEIE